MSTCLPPRRETRIRAILIPQQGLSLMCLFPPLGKGLRFSPCLWNENKSVLGHVPPSPPLRGFPGGSAGKEFPGAMQETEEKRVRSLDGEDPLKKGMATHSSILA